MFHIFLGANLAQVGIPVTSALCENLWIPH